MIGRIPRRGVLAGSLGILLVSVAGRSLGAPALPVPTGRALNFDIIRDGGIVGSHRLRFDPSPGGLIVDIQVDIAIGLGPIVFFRYQHRATEQWQDAQFLSLDAVTNDDGTHHHVSVRRSNGGVLVESTKANYLAPPDSLPATHWNRRMLDGPLINTETGSLMHPHIASLGVDAVPTRSGTTVPAHHFALTGDVVLDTWYDDGPNWMGLAFKGRDGSAIRYERAI